MSSFFNTFKTKMGLLTTALFIFFFGLWLFNIFVTKSEAITTFITDFYFLVALAGASAGFYIAKAWGGYKSTFGKSISFFSLGLLAQSFGQITYAFYHYVLGEDNPYPSIADLGFGATIPLYIFGIYFLAKTCGIKFSKLSPVNWLVSVAVPAVFLVATYFLFLKDYVFEFSPLQTFLDLGYPIGDALYVSFAVVTLILLSRNSMGGLLKPRVVLLITALILQFIADFTYIYETIAGTWVAGGFSDILYLFAYFSVALSIMYIGSAFTELKNGMKKPDVMEESNG